MVDAAVPRREIGAIVVDAQGSQVAPGQIELVRDLEIVGHKRHARCYELRVSPGPAGPGPSAPRRSVASPRTLDLRAPNPPPPPIPPPPASHHPKKPPRSTAPNSMQTGRLETIVEPLVCQESPPPDRRSRVKDHPPHGNPSSRARSPPPPPLHPRTNRVPPPPVPPQSTPPYKKHTPLSPPPSPPTQPTRPKSSSPSHTTPSPARLPPPLPPAILLGGPPSPVCLGQGGAARDEHPSRSRRNPS